MQACLLPKWKALVGELKLREDTCSKWFSRLCTHYNEIQRYYHTLHHVHELLELRDSWRSRIVCSSVVDLSIWFHDAIYQPTRNDNEDQSAKLFVEFSKETELDNQVVEKVCRYIMATKSHKIDIDDSDLKYFLDFDLAILGKPPELYDIYAGQIRQEYIHVPRDKYFVGRKMVLSELSSGGIYLTDDFISASEGKAKENILREIQMLEKGQILGEINQ
eukprot:TRINITY_DN10053_c0_g1_i1.p1 TRINITY_DN10053_c0_g1~~TRINITY_DN10053_c0_g1_i1.p1  ORF type:complete len:219 (-),score=37.07 TRINITY_DN10053_c0_g1_i1:37-693(-)